MFHWAELTLIAFLVYVIYVQNAHIIALNKASKKQTRWYRQLQTQHRQNTKERVIEGIATARKVYDESLAQIRADIAQRAEAILPGLELNQKVANDAAQAYMKMRDVLEEVMDENGYTEAQKEKVLNRITP
jgi:hypothetical protein